MKLKLDLLRNLGATALVATSMLIGLSPVQAATENWSGLTSGTWGTATNWSGSATPDLTYDLTILGPSNVAGALTINIDAAASANSINFTDTAAVTLSNTTSGANQTLTLGVGGLTVGTGAVTIGSATANQNINIALGASQTWNIGTGGLTANNVISDGGSGFGLTKSGAGTLTLNGANTYSGGTTLNAGTIVFGNSSAFGTGAITANGGTLKTTGATTTNALVVNGATTLDAVTGNWYLNGNVSGSGAINRGSSGNVSLYLGGDDSGYTGTFTNPNNANAVLRFNSATAGSAGASWVFANTNAGKTTLSWSGTGAISFGSMTGAGQIQTDIAGAKTISVGALGLNDTFSGTILNGTGTIGLIKVGSGTMTLSGANTYSDVTTISAGTLKLGNNLAIQNSALDTTGAGTMDVTGFTTPTLGGLSGNVNLASVITAGYGNITALTLNPQTGGTSAYSGVITNGAAGMTLTKSGAGTQVLSGANTYSGVTNINAGVLQISAVNNLGDSSATNAISFNGGTLESTANTYDLGSNRNIGMAGAGTIQVDSGALTVSGSISASSTGSKTLTIRGAGNTVISGSIAPGSGVVNLQKLDAGTLTLSGGASIGTATGGQGISNGGSTSLSALLLGGTTKISSGIYTSANEFVVGGVLVNGGAGVNTNLTMDAGSLTINSYLSLGRGNGIGTVSSDIVLNNGAALTATNFSGGFNGGSGLNLSKGTFTLNNTSSFTVATNGAFNLAESAGSNMTMTLSGSSSVTINGTGSSTNRNIGNAGVGTLTLNGAGATFTDASTGVLNIGLVTGTGVLNVNAGTFNHANGELVVAGAQANGSSSAMGTINVGGGTLNTKSLTVGRNNNDVAATLNGTVNVTSGTLNVLTGSLIGWRGIGTNGALNISGGTCNQNTAGGANNMSIGSLTGANATVTVSSGALNFQNNSGVRFADTTGANASTRTLTISGGSVNFYSDAGSTVGGTGVIDMMLTANASGTNTINLDGGTLTANQIKVTSATGTRVINFNGGTLKSGASSLASTFLASGVATAANVRNGGAIINSNGNSVTIGQVLAHSGIGGDNATDGGLTKTGAGALTLTAANTYTGATTVNSGTLAIGTGGSVNSSSGITVNGSGARFVQSNTTTAVSPIVTLTQGTVDGTGTINTVNVGAGTGGIVANGNGTTAQLTIGSLTFNGAGAMNLNIAGGASTATPAIVVSNGLTTSGVANSVTVNLTPTSPLTLGSTYNLLSYGSFAGNAADYVYGGNTPRITGVFGTSNNFLTMTLSGDAPKWTGLDNGQWKVGSTGANSNWKLQTAGTATDYIEGDFALFDDSATGTTSVDISSANVIPGSTTFTNSTVDYTISSSGGFGIAGSGALVKNGTGTVTLTSSNSYTGATTINSGTLQIGNGTTDGSISSTSGITNGGALVYNLAGSQTYSGVISGAGTLTKAGVGTLVLAGTNTYSGGTTITSGTVQVGNGGTAGSLGTGAVNDNGSLVFNRSDSVTQGTDFGTISGTGSVTQRGTGNLTLSSANSYSGGTTLNSGTIIFANGSSLGTGTITLNGGSMRFSYGGTGGGTTTNTMVVNGATTLDVATVAGNWNLNGNIIGSGTITRGTGANASLYLGGDDSGFTGTFTSPNNGNAVVRFNTPSAGSAAASWVFNNATAGRTTLSWPTVGGTISFGSLTGGGEIRADVSGTKTISAGALGANDTFSGIITNPVANSVLNLTKVGTGNMTLTGNNNYTGATNVNSGTLTVNGVNSGTGLVTVASGATLAGSGTIAGAAVISGSLSGSLTLNNDATINSGAFASASAFNGNIVANGTITSALNLLSGKALSGGGTVGTVSVISTGTIAPGTASTTAILTGTGNVTLGDLSNLAHLSMKLGSTTAGTGYDQFRILNGSTLNLTNVNLDGSLLNGYVPTNFATWDGNNQMLTSGDTFYLVIGAGNSLSGKHFANATVGGDAYTGGYDSISFGNQEFAIVYNANFNGGTNSALTGGNDIALVAVPEPSTWAMLISGLGLLSFWQRSRRKSV